MRSFFERIEDWYLTRKTGKDRAQREWIKWYEENVNMRASTISGMFEKFEYVIEVNPSKIFRRDSSSLFTLTDEAEEYFWPKRPPGRACVIRIEQVDRGYHDNELHLVPIGGQDRVFVATNDPEDATMISLRWS